MNKQIKCSDQINLVKKINNNLTINCIVGVIDIIHKKGN